MNSKNNNIKKMFRRAFQFGGFVKLINSYDAQQILKSWGAKSIDFFFSECKKLSEWLRIKELEKMRATTT